MSMSVSTIYVVIEDSKAMGFSTSEKEAKTHLLRRAQSLADKNAELSMRIEDDGLTIKLFISGFLSGKTITHLLSVTVLKEITQCIE